MVRKQVYVTAEQDASIKRLARQCGVTEAEVIRRGIQLVERESEPEESARQAWLDELAYMKRRAAENPAVPGGKRAWTRDELYDERPKYLSRRL